MAITLAQFKASNLEDLQKGAIDEFRKNSFIIDKIPWDNSVSPFGNGGTLTYSYIRQTTQPSAAFRAVNEEYTAAEVENTKYSTDVKILGGSYQLDRISNYLGGAVEYEAQQMNQKIKAVSALFVDTSINGDSATNSKQFDGLDKMITGSSTEFNADGAVTLNLSSSANITSNYAAFLDYLDECMMQLDEKPSFIGGNTALISKIRACARRSAMYSTTLNEFGQQVEAYAGIPLVDFGAKAGSNNPIVPTDSTTGCTDIYMATFGEDAFHAISLDSGIIKAIPADFSTSGSVKTGSVEMYAAVVLKRSKAAGIIRGVQVAAVAEGGGGEGGGGSGENEGDEEDDNDPESP